VGHREGPAGRAARILHRHARVEGGELELFGAGIGAQDTQVGDHRLRPRPGKPARPRSPEPPRNPQLVRKSTRATKLRGDCFMITSTLRAWAAISGAPPDPGRRTVGCE